MIRYALACECGHEFESWFADSAAYDKQAKRRLINCPACGSSKVAKAIMAPRLVGAREAGGSEESVRAPEKTGPVAMIPPQELALRKKLKELHDQITKNADFVGRRFPEEARKMHYGEIEPRAIYGEATPEQAKDLHEEGIEFYPLPALPDEQN
ncbi:MAG TPA: DUF1178 family protein [Xanthobacteraceae bacterium]|nr:DUF1178 family protein [Xanthobacteraceae bacterium]